MKYLNWLPIAALIAVAFSAWFFASGPLVAKGPSLEERMVAQEKVTIMMVNYISAAQKHNFLPTAEKLGKLEDKANGKKSKGQKGEGL